jgi:hypothetical protein
VLELQDKVTQVVEQTQHLLVVAVAVVEQGLLAELELQALVGLVVLV